MVGVQGFEPWTPWSQTRCATRLRHTPNKLVRPERFELPTPTFVALYSIQMSYGRMMNLRAYAAFIVDLFRTYRPPSLTSSTMDITWVPVQLATICVDPTQAINRELNPSPFTNLVLRRNLISVTVLADTLKTWRSQRESNPSLRRDRAPYLPIYYRT